jgi:uncharacterized RDD family membrane protein YckC
VIAEGGRTRAIRNVRARTLQGTRAGIVSRCAADGIDLVAVLAIYFGILVAVGVVRYLVLQQDFNLPNPALGVTTVVSWVIAVLYLTAGWTSTGRTIGKGTMGLRVVSSRGRPLSPRHAFFRALICATFGWIVLPWIIVSRRRSGFHDILLHTTVVYDWISGT